MIRITLLEDSIGNELARLQSLATPAQLGRLALSIARVIQKAGDDTFRVSGTPNKPWAPRKDTTKPHRLLILSQTLRKSLNSIAQGSGAAVVTDRPYARFHQTGTKHMVARPFIPVDQSGRLEDSVAEKVNLSIRRKIDSLRKGSTPAGSESG